MTTEPEAMTAERLEEIRTAYNAYGAGGFATYEGDAVGDLLAYVDFLRRPASGEVADVVKRQLSALRNAADALYANEFPGPLLRETATVIETLSAEAAELRRELERLRAYDTGMEASIKETVETFGAMRDRALKAESSLAGAEEMRRALQTMVDAEVDYMTRNKLGDPEKLDRIIAARRALSPEVSPAPLATPKAEGGGAMDKCSRCGGIGCICLACGEAIDDCECFEDSEPCPCDRCDGSGNDPLDDDEAEGSNG